jgi:nitroreductase
MDALELLHTRESAGRLSDPAPSDSELAAIFKSASRAPDHGRLRPWRFVVIRADARERFGDVMAVSLKSRQPDAAPETLARERAKALRAPLIVVVGVQIQSDSKIPEIEQILSGGAAAQNIMLAAHALGYGAAWKTGEPAYDAQVKEALGLQATAVIVGFIYLGTRTGGPSPLPRPAPQDFVTEWRGQ